MLASSSLFSRLVAVLSVAVPLPEHEEVVMGDILDSMHKLSVEGVRISMAECARQIGVTTSDGAQVLRRKT
jgi:hypothetical protein